MARIRGQGVRTAPIILAGDFERTVAARDEAIAAKDAAVAAQLVAEAAAEAALTHEGNSEAAQAAAEAARDAAQTAQSMAEAAQAAAETARAGAETARTGAETARTGAEVAQGLSEDAQAAAETAQGLAEDAQAAAEAAETAAQVAEDAAEDAQAAAEAAQTAAETARTGAETARTGAETARSGAEAAQAAAEDARDEAAGYAASINPATLMPKTGGVFSGDVTWQYPWPTIRLRKSSAAEANQIAGYNTGGVLNWIIRPGHEGADNDFAILRFDNSGAFVDNSVVIARSSGIMTLSQRPVFGTATPWDSDNFTPGNYYSKAEGDARYPKLVGANAFDTRPTYEENTPWDNGNLEGAAIGHGQCRLVCTSSTVITLVPFNGNRLVIGGVSRVLPNAGPTLSNAGFTGRYIYAYWTGSSIALESSSTGHERDTNTGVEIKIGDASRTLVGMAQLTGGLFADSQLTRYVASWFNRRHVTLRNTSIVGTSASSIVNLSNNYLNFICWADSKVHASYTYSLDCPDNGTGNTYLTIDGSNVSQGYTYAQANTGNWFDQQSGTYENTGLDETTNHYSGISGNTSGTGTMQAIGLNVHTMTVEI